MADREVFRIVNRNHHVRAVMDAIDSNLDIAILKDNLDAISARRRKSHVQKMSLLRRKS
jgi:hypothetical protein